MLTIIRYIKIEWDHMEQYELFKPENNIFIIFYNSTYQQIILTLKFSLSIFMTTVGYSEEYLED